MGVSKICDRDIARMMRYIIDRSYDTNGNNVALYTDDKDLSNICDSLRSTSGIGHTLDVLIGLGLISVCQQLKKHNRIILTPQGVSYFENKSITKKDTLTKSVLIPIIVAVITVLISNANWVLAWQSLLRFTSWVFSH